MDTCLNKLVPQCLFSDLLTTGLFQKWCLISTKTLQQERYDKHVSANRSETIWITAVRKNLNILTMCIMCSDNHKMKTLFINYNTDKHREQMSCVVL